MTKRPLLSANLRASGAAGGPAAPSQTEPEWDPPPAPAEALPPNERAVRTSTENQHHDSPAAIFADAFTAAAVLSCFAYGHSLLLPLRLTSYMLERGALRPIRR